MFVARRFFRKNKLMKNLIYTSNVLNCGKPKDENTFKNLTNYEEKGEVRKNIIGNPKKKQSKNFRRNESTLGLPKRVFIKSAEIVAEEFGGDTNKTVGDILNHLEAMDISRDESHAFEHMEGEYIKSQKHSEHRIEFRFEHLNIFDSEIMKETESQIKLKIWDDLEAENLNYLSKISPKNWFEEMIVWTKEGKLWQFPIDNDQGMEKEAEICFTEHIFMEQNLEPWCPKKGPLRKFMELVLIGLSKNHYYTVQEKKAHIDWFRTYFEEKKKLLKELGAMGSEKETIKEIEVSSAIRNQ